MKSSEDKTQALGLAYVPALAVQSYQLLMARGPEVNRTWPLTDILRIGKDPENDVVIVDATVSRQHATIQNTAGGIVIRDLGSTNGTFLDDTRIMEAFIRPGMFIRVGEVVLKLISKHEEVHIAPSQGTVFGDLVGSSAVMRRIFALLERVAKSDMTVLITGETGTGKGAVARAIHDRSERAKGPFVTVDCGAIAKSLIESELFGHEKGAFTGAVQQRRGALEVCEGGTLFIDELDDMPLDIQPRLLRALDAREIVRVGSAKPIKVDLRVVAATKKELPTEVAAGHFREDLYYRLSVVTVNLPPLRDRIEDLPLLVDKLLGGVDQWEWNRLPKKIREGLSSHVYPGNVRELRNILERATHLEGFDGTDPLQFPIEHRSADVVNTELKLTADYMKPFKEAKDALIDRFEREYLRRLLGRSANNMTRAAREAGIDRKYLYMLLEKHGIVLDELDEPKE